MTDWSLQGERTRWIRISIPVSIDSIRVSLVSAHRIVVLKDNEDRFLPIWIGPFEADAISIALQGNQVARPLTHDLLKTVIHEVGGTLSHIAVTDLREDTFYAQIVMQLNDKRVELGFAAQRRDRARGAPPNSNLRCGRCDGQGVDSPESERRSAAPAEDEKLDAFRDLIEDLDMDGLGKGGDSPKEE